LSAPLNELSNTSEIGIARQLIPNFGDTVTEEMLANIGSTTG